MPGISVITMTAGPSPLRYTSWVAPSWLNGATVNVSRSPSGAVVSGRSVTRAFHHAQPINGWSPVARSAQLGSRRGRESQTGTSSTRADRAGVPGREGAMVLLVVERGEADQH